MRKNILLFTMGFFLISTWGWSQNVGISNSAGFTNPQSPLHIYWTSDGNLLQLSRSTSANTGLTFSVSSNDYSILNRQNNALILGTNGTEYMRIRNNGNVGIGTTVPGGKLEVNMGNNNNYFRVDQDNNIGVELRSGTSTGTPFIDFSNDASTDYDARIRLTGNDYLAIEGTNVGIGTTSPSYKLHVTANQATGYGTGLIHAVNTATSNDAAGVYGECASTDYWGYGGYFKGGYKGVEGVVFPTGSSYYFGLEGYVYGGSGTNYGVYGYSYGSGTNYGVYAAAYGGNHNDVGVYGNVSETGAHGIRGYNGTTSTTSDYTTSAVYGESTYDVNGISSNTVYNAAVQGWDTPPDDRDGIGVYGHCWPDNYCGYGGWFNGGYYGVKGEGYSGNYYKSGNLNSIYSGGVLAKGMIGVNSIGSKIGLVTVSNELGLLSIGDIHSNAPAAFFDGSVIRSGYEAMLIDDGEDNVPAYTMVSNKVTIQSAGQASLNNGSATINFDNSFSSIVSSTQPIIVIITPTSQNTGTIVVTNTSANGFEVTSNNNSNGTFNWIAIASVKGYETASVKQEYTDQNFINDKVDAIYPTSKDFPQFKSSDFFKTEKLKSTVKHEDIKDMKDMKEIKANKK